MNKVSGNGRALKVWHLLEKILLKKNINYCVRFTEEPKQATAFVHELLGNEQTKVIIAVGGDGTVHEVINGLVGSTIPLGVIPAGSGNDFCRQLRIPLRSDKALERILRHEPKRIDLGRIDDKYFATVVGVGFDGQVALTTNRSKYKKILNIARMGGISYIIGVIKVLHAYKPMTVHLKIDHTELKLTKVWLIAIANSPFYAGGMAICPDAQNNDGLLDICIVQELTKRELLYLFPSVFKGRHINHPSVTIYRGKEIEIFSESPLLVHGDGEMIGQTPVNLTIEPNYLYVI